jgi:dolichol-phosphate mannosyltransferase
MLSTAAPVVAVMDGDLQHDEGILPQMLDKLRQEDLDVVVGSRNVDGGSMGDFAWHRRWLSDAGKRLSALVCRCEVQDPMSGFFLVRRSFVEGAARNMSAVGFKILVDLISSSETPARLGEVPYRFGQRQYGESKLETTVLLDFAYLIADKLVGRVIPFRFLLFAMAGLGGLLLHLAVLAALLFGEGLSFLRAQAIATVSAMVVNYLINNWFTFRDRRRKGWGILGGLESFCLACSVGALANLAIAEMLFTRGVSWYLAGALGTLVGAVWNFSVTSVFTWRQGRRTIERRSETAERAAAQQWEELCASDAGSSFVRLAQALSDERPTVSQDELEIRRQ